MFFIDYTKFKQTEEIDEISEKIKLLESRKNFLISERNKEVINSFDDMVDKYPLSKIGS